MKDKIGQAVSEWFDRNDDWRKVEGDVGKLKDSLRKVIKENYISIEDYNKRLKEECKEYDEGWRKVIEDFTKELKEELEIMVTHVFGEDDPYEISNKSVRERIDKVKSKFLEVKNNEKANKN